jgi:hypothetical protein
MGVMEKRNIYYPPRTELKTPCQSDWAIPVLTLQVPSEIGSSQILIQFQKSPHLISCCLPPVRPWFVQVTYGHWAVGCVNWAQYRISLCQEVQIYLQPPIQLYRGSLSATVQLTYNTIHTSSAWGVTPLRLDVRNRVTAYVITAGECPQFAVPRSWDACIVMKFHFNRV